METQGEESRRQLYRDLLNDKSLGYSDKIKKYSFRSFQDKLLNDDKAQARLTSDLIEKGKVRNGTEFYEKYILNEAKPSSSPKQQAVAPPPVEAPPMEEEAYIPEPQPVVGSPEYDAQLQAQYGGMSPTLGATFAGTPAAFETKAQKKQEQISPVFKAQQLAFEDVPIAEEQRRSQREFAKATKAQQQAAVRGGTGFEYEQAKKDKERSFGDFVTDFDKVQVGLSKQVGENILTGIKNQILEFSNIGVAPMSEDEPEAAYYQREAARRGQQLYQEAAETQRKFQEELAKRNIKTSIYDAVQKGEWNKVPEATAYTIGEAAVQMAAFALTMGGSAYLQTLPQEYMDEVDAIAAETNRTPEQVIADGDDAPLTAKFSSGIQYALEKIGMDEVSNAMASKGAYRAVRDWLLKKSGNRNLARAAGLGAVASIESLTESEQTGVSQAATLSTSQKPFSSKVEKFFKDPALRRERIESAIAGGVGGLALGGGGQLIQSAMDRTLFEAPKIGKATDRVDYNIVQTDDKIQQRSRMLQAMEAAIQANPEAEGQIRERYRKLTDALELTDQEVLNAYDGTAQLPPSPERDRIIQGLEEYMSEKGIQPEATGMEAGLGEGLRVTSPEETITAPPIITQPPVEPVEPITTEEAPIEEVPMEEAPTTGMFEGIEGPPQEAPVAPEEEVITEEAPVGEEVITEEESPQPKAGDFVIVNGEKGVVVVTPGGQMSVETDTKIYDLDERGIAGIGGRLVAPKEKTQTEYEVEVIDDDNALVNGEPFQIIRDEKGNTIALQGENRTIRTEPVMVDVDIKRNKAQVKETPQQQAEEVESLSPDMTLDKQGFVDDIIGQNMTEGVDRILSDGVTENTQERDLLQFKLFVEATIADLRTRQKGNPYAEAMIEQLQEALNTVYYEYYSQGRKAEARTSKTEKKTNRGVKGKERVSPKPAEGKQPVTPKPAPVTPAAPKAQPVAEKKEEKPAPKAEPKEEKPTTGVPQEGSRTELPPQSKYTTEPRRMVFKDGEWKQEVGGQIVSVGEPVQKQAQEAFSEKTEAKAEETRPTAESFANDLEKALNAMKVKVDKGAALEGTFMIPVLVYNGAIDAAILAVKAGKTVVDAINIAVKYVNDNLKGDWDNGGFIGKLSVDLTKPMESYEDYKRVKGKGKEPSPGQKVGVRFNLNIQDYGRRNVLSVHEKSYNGEVIDIVKSSTLSDVKFSASKSGASKIKEGLSNKFPIASVDGSFVSSDADKTLTESGQRVFFNPRVADFFYDKDGREVLSASKATLDGSKVFADGLEYGERLAPINQQPSTATTTQAEFTSKQEGNASTEFDGIKKPSKIKTKSFDNKYGKGAFERMQNITQNFEDIMDGLSEKIKQDCL